MAHKHPVYDTDAHFKINHITRAITTQDDLKTIMQGDHNSERFSFEIPNVIDGHDMKLCNKVLIHYMNGTNEGLAALSPQCSTSQHHLTSLPLLLISSDSPPSPGFPSWPPVSFQSCRVDAEGPSSAPGSAWLP